MLAPATEKPFPAHVVCLGAANMSALYRLVNLGAANSPRAPFPAELAHLESGARAAPAAPLARRDRPAGHGAPSRQGG